MSSGIYKITNAVNNKIYIGSTVNIDRRRRKHFWMLKNNCHHSSYLQNSYNKHGINFFKFDILLECAIEDLLKIEQYFIDQFQPEYNINKIAGSALGKKHSAETKRKLSIMKKGQPNGREGVKLSEETKNRISKGNTGKKRTADYCKTMGERFAKAIYQICPITNKILAEYQSIREAGEITGIHPVGICAVLRGRSKTAGKYIWEYKNKIT